MQDTRFAARSLRGRPLFAVTIIALLAAGIGVNTIMFSLLDSVVLRPLPYFEPERLISITETNRGEQRETDASTTAAGFLDWRAQSESFEHMAAFSSTGFTLTAAEFPERLVGMWVSGDFFELLGAPPIVGRGFLPAEQRQEPEVIIAHALWTTRYAGDIEVVGTVLRLNEIAYRIAGVAPPGFTFGGPVQIWAAAEHEVPPPPIDLGPDYTTDRSMGYLDVVARLAPGVSLAQATEEMQAISAAISEAFPQEQGDRGVSLRPLHGVVVGDVRTPLTGLVTAVGFVLLIACTNVAGLLLARAASRHGEMALRGALGASRTRLFRQLLLESLFLSSIGGAAGIALATLGLPVLVAVLPAGLPRLGEIGVDSRLMLFAAGLSVIAGLAFGCLPALQSSRADLQRTLSPARGSTTGRQRARSMLVVAEIALALVLVIGAGLMLKSFVGLATIDPGFEPDGVLAVSVSLDEERYPDDAMAREVYARALGEMRAVPGVESAGLVLALPFSGSAARVSFAVAGEVPDGGDAPNAIFQTASPGYFETLRIPLRRGRLFDDRDRVDGEQVVIVNEELVRRHVPDGRDPLTVALDFGDGDTYPIVGVVGSVRHDGFGQEVKPEVYVPVDQLPWRFATFLLRTGGDPASLVDAARGALAAADPRLPTRRVQPLTEVLSASLGQPRLVAGFLAAFATAALVLAAVGIFGLVSYEVGQRAREFGVRMALGARRIGVARMVIGQVLRLSLIAFVVGLAASLWLTRAAAGLLHAVSPIDPPVYVAAIALLGTAALVAGAVPALRATRVDPATALRSAE